MRIAVTGATGFLGRYIVNHLLEQGHRCCCWHRSSSDRGGFINEAKIEWIPGQLDDAKAATRLVKGAEAVVHGAVAWRGAFGRGDVVDFAQTNIIGSLCLMKVAKQAGVQRFIFIASCAVHEIILDDRQLDEAHPLWPTSAYGAYKAAVEKYVHSFGFGQDWAVSSLRPTGIYGLRRPIERTRWFNMVRDVAAGHPVHSPAGGKEVHAADVAKAVGILLESPADTIAGQAYNCCDMYVAEQDVAAIAKQLTGSNSEIATLNHGPKYQIDTSKIRQLGMKFGGRALLEETIGHIADAIGVA